VPFNSSPRMDRGQFQDTFHDNFLMHPPVMRGPLFQFQGTGSGGQPAPYFSSTSSFSNHHGAGGGQWVSESQSTSIVNGLTTRVHERVDSSGNKHTTTTHPDGRRTYAINGVLQPSGQTDAPPPFPHLAPPLNTAEFPHYHNRRHRHDHSRGRYDRPGAHRAYDRDYPPHHHHPYA